MKLHHFKTALHHASLNTSRLLSAQLRAEARASGWPDDIVRHMSVHYDGEFKVKAHPDHESEIANLEYGTPDTQPTAAIRRFSNRTHEAEKFLLKHMYKQVGKL